MALAQYCKELDIDEAVLNGQKEKDCETKTVLNGVMWELRKYKTAKKLTMKEFVDWMIQIFKVKCENNDIVQASFSRKLEALATLRTFLSKQSQRYRGEVERLMNSPFDFPDDMGMDPVDVFEPMVSANLGPKLLKVLKEKGGDVDENLEVSADDDDEQAKKKKAREELVQLKKDLTTVKKAIVSMNEKLNDLNKRSKILNDLSQSSVSERRSLETDLSKLKSDWQKEIKLWHDCMERLNHVITNKSNYLDIGYMVRRNRTKQGIFDELNYEFEKTVEDFKHKVNNLVEKDRKKKKVVSREYRQKSKSDRKRTRQDDDLDDNKRQCLSEDISDSKEAVLTVDDFLKSDKVDEFKGGKYLPALKAIYTELTTQYATCKDVHEIMFSVLDDLEVISTDKIPSATFGGNIYMEARMLVALQAFSDLLNISKISICNEGSVQFTFHSPVYEVKLPNNTLQLAVRDLTHGSPDTSLSGFKNMILEICSFKMEANKTCEELNRIAKSFISNIDLLSKPLMEMIFVYKQLVTPILLDDSFALLPESLHTKVNYLNNFCSGLYLLLGLAKLVDSSVLCWETAFVKEYIQPMQCSVPGSSSIESVEKMDTAVSENGKISVDY